MRRGRRLGVDVGQVRVGVAVCDPDGILATPLATVSRRGRPGHPGGPRSVADLAVSEGVIEVIVGLPRSLNGREGRAAQDARRFAAALAPLVAPAQIRLVDERFTTTSAHADLRASGVDTRRHRAVVDQQAAVRILQLALDVERASDFPVGGEIDSRRSSVCSQWECSPAQGPE
ncbi:MAG: Holliday junction resolvase RuvX [Dermatophilaceae bacterium]